MTTILLAFLIAFFIALIATPLARRFGVRFGAIDVPNARKTHKAATPRTGGIAIFFAFLLVALALKLWEEYVTVLIPFDRRFWFFLLGAAVVFGVGVVDDFHRLRPSIKFLFQVLAASIAFYGGLQIWQIGLITGGFTIQPLISYGVTIFWFVLIINAMNLIDGMDGLAGGIAFFACFMTVVLCIIRHTLFPAVFFAALAGGILGFLRYNFKPATIFLGDGGSYFLGYAIAGLSLMASAKAETGVVLLLPLVGLGIPVFDSFLAPLRRFIRGRNLFSPDNEHIHHRLTQMGLSRQKAVWVLYGISCALCVFALIVANIRNERSGFFLVFLGVAAVLFIRKMGYFDYFEAKKIFSWFQDVSDVTGIAVERRSFLGVQMDMAAAKDLEGLWAHTVTGLRMLRFDVGEMALNGTEVGCRKSEDGERWVRFVDPATLGFPDRRKGAGDRRSEGSKEGCWVCGKNHRTMSGWHSIWVRNGFDLDKDICEECLLKLELPLLDEGGAFLGTLWLLKDLKREPVTHYTLRRIEHLRRTLTANLVKFK